MIFIGMKLTSILKEIKVLKPNPFKYKTHEWWLYQLPEPYRTQALNNTKAKINEERYNLFKNKECNFKHDALMHAFTWSNTPEGGAYWSDIYGKLENNEPLTEIKVSNPSPPKEFTILWWLHKLPEPYRTQAINNYKNETGEEYLKKRNNAYLLLTSALSFAFAWKNTPEGWIYWSNLWEKS